MAAGYDVRCSACKTWGPSHPGIHNRNLTASDKDVLIGGDQDTIGGAGYDNYISGILSSGKLTSSQIKAASISNVMTLFDAPAAVKDEFAHFLQRFIIDGFLRGVDVVAIMKSGSKRWVYSIEEQGSNVLATAQGRSGVSTNGSIEFDDDFWDSGTSYEKKLQLFYHEMGHAALARPHDDDGIMEQGVNGDIGMMSNYNAIVNELFGEAQRGRGTASTAGGGSGSIETLSGSSSSSAVAPTPPAPPAATPTTIKLNVGGGVETNMSAISINGQKQKAPGSGADAITNMTTTMANASFAAPDVLNNPQVAENTFSKTLTTLGAASLKNPYAS
ncbi:neutrophil collagenasE [Caudoviricetes sp.]|nr:neutrophil collagenase [Caudoviricetes sp.]UOF79136.1 neutrophil collagenasE [Caudoviricetes sp.]